MEAEKPHDLSVSGATPPAGRQESNDRRDSPAGTELRALFTRTQRRKLPDERKSFTHKFSVGGHEGYIIAGIYEEGTPGEIFIKMAKEGSTLSGFMDGVALSISIGLQYGVPLNVFVDKLTNTRFEPSGYTENPNIRYASSVLDYIGRWLGGKFVSYEYLKPRGVLLDQGGLHKVTASPAETLARHIPLHAGNDRRGAGDAPSCPTCGMLMAPNGSCYKCTNCGGTSGCS